MMAKATHMKSGGMRGARWPALALLLAAAVALAACGGIRPVGDNSVQTRHPISIQERQRFLDIALGTDGHAAIAEARVRIEQFAREYRKRGIGTMSVAFPESASAVVADLDDLLLDFGVPPEALRYRIRSDDAQVDASEVVVSLSFGEHAAVTAPCGDFRENLGYNPNNLPAVNFGCAYQHNLAASLANPRDLVEPRPVGAASSERFRLLLEQYRAGSESEQSGATLQ